MSKSDEGAIIHDIVRPSQALPNNETYLMEKSQERFKERMVRPPLTLGNSVGSE